MNEKEKEERDGSSSNKYILYLAAFIAGGIVIYLFLRNSHQLSPSQLLGLDRSIYQPLENNSLDNSNRINNNNNSLDNSNRINNNNNLVNNTMSNILSIQKLQLQESSKMNELLSILSKNQILTTKQLQELSNSNLTQIQNQTVLGSNKSDSTPSLFGNSLYKNKETWEFSRDGRNYIKKVEVIRDVKDAKFK